MDVIHYKKVTHRPFFHEQMRTVCGVKFRWTQDWNVKRTSDTQLVTCETCLLLIFEEENNEIHN